MSEFPESIWVGYVDDDAPYLVRHYTASGRVYSVCGGYADREVACADAANVPSGFAYGVVYRNVVDDDVAGKSERFTVWKSYTAK